MTTFKIKTICVVTGSRADYGLLYCLLEELAHDNMVDLQIVVTGMHLSPEFGLTYKVIETDGFHINEKVEMLLSSDTPNGVSKSIGLGIVGFSDVFSRLKPDILVVLGDRFEIFSAVVAALASRIPVAHICGGDSTEGAFDELIRHSISKMAHIHFVTNEIARKRVIQLGENPDRVFNFGSPGLDILHSIKYLDRTSLEKEINFKFREKNLLVTFHPETYSREPTENQFANLLQCLEEIGDEYGLIFTKPNADTDGRALIRSIDDFISRHMHRAKAYTSLGQKKYLSLLRIVDCVVGNSSSGLYEAPSLKTPTVNIGDRQKGRLFATSVLHCKAEKNEIRAAIFKAIKLDCSGTINPYGDGNASSRIKEVLKRIMDPNDLVSKSFFDISHVF